MTVRLRGCPEELLKQIPDLAARETIDEVFLSAGADVDEGVEDEWYVSPGLEDLIRHPGLRGVRRLHLYDGYLDPSYLIPLLVDAHWRDSLEVLVMGPEYCEGDVLRALATAALPTLLVELRMQGWSSDYGLRELAQARWLPRLHCLELGTRGLTDDGMQYLAAAEGLSLRWLDLHGDRRLDDHGRLDTGNAVSADGIAALAETSWFPKLEFLGLAMCGVPGNAGAHAALARGASLEGINLSGLGLTWEFLQDAPELPVWRSLKTLTLSHNPIGDDGAKMMAQCRTLPATLLLRSCDIGPDGLRFLAKAPPVQELDMRHNRLGVDDWMRALEEDHLPRTESLRVDAAGWTDDGIQLFEARYPEFHRGRKL